MNYEDLADRALHGGFTVNVVTGDEPTTGFAVGTRPDAELGIHMGPRTIRDDVADAIYSYVVDHGYDLRDGYYLGAWRDGETIVLDLVQVFNGPRRTIEAVAAAKAFDQDAIYDLATGTTIALR